LIKYIILFYTLLSVYECIIISNRRFTVPIMYTIWDPITCAHYLYRSSVLRWSDDGRYTAETCCHVVN